MSNVQRYIITNEEEKKQYIEAIELIKEKIRGEGFHVTQIDMCGPVGLGNLYTNEIPYLDKTTNLPNDGAYLKYRTAFEAGIIELSDLEKFKEFRNFSFYIIIPEIPIWYDREKDEVYKNVSYGSIKKIRGAFWGKR